MSFTVLEAAEIIGRTIYEWGLEASENPITKVGAALGIGQDVVNAAMPHILNRSESGPQLPRGPKTSSSTSTSIHRRINKYSMAPVYHRRIWGTPVQKFRAYGKDYVFPYGKRAARQYMKWTKKSAAYRRSKRAFSASLKQNANPSTHGGGGRIHVKKKTFYAPVATNTELGAIPSVGAITNTTLTNPASGKGSTGRAFILEDFPDYATYQGIYQYYKILYVKVIYYPQQNGYPAQDGNGSGVFGTGATALKSAAPEVVVAPDAMTSQVFSNIESALNHDQAKYHVFNDSKELVVYVQPTIKATEGEVGSVINVPGKPMWIPTSSQAVPHYGLRCYWANFNQNTSFRIMYEMKVAFKGLKS